MADPVQTYPLNPVPVGPVDPNPELAYAGRGVSTAFPNNGVVFPGGVEAVASLTGHEQKSGLAPMQTDAGYVLTAGDDAERQSTAATPGADATRSQGGEGGGRSSGFVPGQPGGVQGGATTQAAPGTAASPGMSSQQAGPEVLEQPRPAGAGQAPSNAAQGGRNVPNDPYPAPTPTANPETPAVGGLEAPDAPTGVTPTQGASNMTVSVAFTAPDNAGDRPITAYNVYDGNTKVGTGATSPIVTSALTAGAHTLSVTAVTAAGEGPRGTAAPLTVVTKP